MVVDPENANVIYLAAPSGVDKSEDGGATWTTYPIAQLDPFEFPGALAIDASNPQSLFAASFDAKVMHSVNAGRTWSHVGSLAMHASIGSLLIDPNDSNHLMATTTWPEGVYDSIDGGQTWTNRSQGLEREDGRIGKLVADPSTAGVFYANTSSNVVRTNNGGQDWEVVGRNLGSGVFDMALSLSDPKVIYSIGSRGLYRSRDMGEQWTKVLREVSPRALAGRLAIDSTDPDRLYAGTRGDGLYWSIDAGEKWQQASGISAVAIESLRQDPRDPQTLYAAAGSAGLYKSKDLGEHWESMNAGFDQNSRIVDLTIAGNILYAQTSYALYRSTDGSSWIRTDFHGGFPINAEIRSVVLHPTDSNTLYVAFRGADSDPRQGVTKTVSRGFGWEDVSEGLPDTGEFWGGTPDALAISPADPNVLFVGLSQIGIYKSINGGQSWHESSNGIPPLHFLDFFSILFDPNDANTVYAGTWGGGVYRTTNGGDEWVLLDSGLPLGILELAIDPDDSNTLYAGSFSSGFFKTTNRGDEWVLQPHPERAPQRISAIMPTSGAGLFIGTNRGVIKRAQ